ncbi:MULTISPECIES: NADPH-dependent 7-cyano-7-deazaguanine reductase QueF [unclassified Lysobacter]|uniref:NADPH-dependent 7-cyano-7-deazaguanine reductase QueF n=1 Tax=unclassified Lysobacter TaxID=2635362 RepID=UPI00070020F9|nr:MULTISPECIES: NADPH-dependent 7-cyano-7-deazaguanine reductase QueF [unclassified Lysobacter]KRA17109.1 NADPH-dependent 7-cyano-7-deazaguanine reductase [Lysobacter sp. Root604]KRD31425.1 NADPH-dependent 7-cyano-7-deazaguanine reductase [Lysobacter sp. Root916]
MTQELPLGRHVDYPREYDPSLLFPIARALGRSHIGLSDQALPFVGLDRWHAYELSWLDPRGKPCMATATLTVPADSPNLVESKSLKLYLNSYNASRFDSAEAVRARIVADLSASAGAPVEVVFGLPPVREAQAVSLDDLDVAIDDYGPPNAAHLAADPAMVVEETLSSGLLKSNCPVTGQPDWARVDIAYRGPRLDRAGLLRYLVSFRDHAEFHEQCVERIFADLLRLAAPQALSVEARYTRRGGLDINPWRATAGFLRPQAHRDERQ